MNEEEKKAINDFKRTVELYEAKPIGKISVEFDEFDYKIVKIVLNLIEKLQKENEELKNRCRNLDKEAQAYLEELAGDNTLTRRTIKQLQEENEECKLDVQDYLKQAQENAEMYRKAQKKIQDLKAENEELKKFIIEGITIEPNSPYKNYQLDFLRKNFIPRQNIKDKIEELNINLVNMQGEELLIYESKIEALQELLEKE